MAVAPPRGERGLKLMCFSARQRMACRSPSWGAWIEISAPLKRRGFKPGRSPSWGAWIEIPARLQPYRVSCVAPPRGERGLKWGNV